MRAINLIPADERRGAGGAGGRSAGGAYVLIGALVVLVAMAATYALTTKTLHDRKAELVTVKRDTEAAQARAASLAGYTAFRDMRKQRVDTVRSIAASRFDWAHAMHELARTLPADAAIGSLRGTVTSGVTINGGATVALRSALPSNPAIEMAGCVPTQQRVASLLVNLRRMDGVRRVTLQRADVTKKVAGAIAPANTSVGAKGTEVKDCDTTFQAVVFYDPVTAITPPAAATATAASTTTTPTDGAAR